MALDLSSELQGRFRCLFLVTPRLVSLAANDITIMVITKGLLWNGFPGWKGGHSRALRGSSSHYRLPNRCSISSQPDFFILKNGDAQNNSFLHPQGNDLEQWEVFLETFLGPLIQQEVWALRRAWITSEGMSSLAWEPHWTQHGSLWTLSCRTLYPQKDALNNTSQRKVSSNTSVFLVLKINSKVITTSPSTSQLPYPTGLLNFPLSTYL